MRSESAFDRLLILASVVVGAVTTAIAVQRRAAWRREQLSNERIGEVALAYKKDAMGRSQS